MACGRLVKLLLKYLLVNCIYMSGRCGAEVLRSTFRVNNFASVKVYTLNLPTYERSNRSYVDTREVNLYVLGRPRRAAIRL
jgi:hypothetical protein